MKKNAAKIISIFSCKGGVGKTTTTLNLAGIYSLMEKKVLVLDFDLNGGGIAVSLGVDATKSVFNVVEDMSNNKFDSISNYICKYNDNIDVLAAPKDPRDAFKIESKYIDLVISSVIYKYDVILIDTSHVLSPIVLKALDKSDSTLFMVTNDPVDLKNARSMIAIFEDTNKDNYKVVFNSSKDTGKDYFTLFDVKTIIKHNIDYTIDRSFYIKDIDKYVIDKEILTLNNHIRSIKKSDVQKLTKIALSLLDEKKKKDKQSDEEGVK